MSGARRPRQIRSCLTCRRRRLRCDKVHPSCSRCTQSQIPCHYQVSDFPEDEPTGPAGPSPADVLPVPFAAHLHPDHAVHPQYLSPTFWGNQGAHSDHDLDEFLQNVTRAALQSPQQSSPLPEAHDFASERWRRSSVCKFCGKRVTMPCMLSLLPPREACEQLRDHFFATIYPLVPILDLPLFNNYWDAFWSEGPGQRPHSVPPGPTVRQTPAFICIMFSILFASTAASCYGTPHEIASRDTYLSATITSLSLTGFPRRATPGSLAAYLFMQSLVIKEEEFLDAPAFLSHAYRIALGMGLHRDGKVFGLEPRECESRRKVWWYIIHLDVMAAASSGLPPLHVDDRISDTKMISALPDGESATTPSGADIEQQADIRHLVAIARFTITKTIRQLLCRRLEGLQYEKYLPGAKSSFHNLCQVVGKTIARLLDTDWENVNEEDLLQPHAAAAWMLSSNESNVKAFRSYSATLLHLMLHKTAIAMYQPLFQQRRPPTSSPKPLEQRARLDAVRHCHEFLRLFLHLCTQPDSETFHWMYPGTYQPLQPLSILLADLLENPRPSTCPLPTSTSSSHMRETSRCLIDQVLTLYQIDHGVVDRYRNSILSQTQHGSGQAPLTSHRRNLSSVGREAWYLLLRTRERVCRIAGEDPHVLWPGDLPRDPNETECCCGLKFEMVGRSSLVQTRRAQQHGPVSGEGASMPVSVGVDAARANVEMGGDSAGSDDDGLDEDESGTAAGMGPEGFDWAEWDAVLGSGTSVFPWDEGGV